MSAAALADLICGLQLSLRPGRDGTPSDSEYFVQEDLNQILDGAKVTEWAKANLPKFVLIHDFEMSGSEIELNSLQQRKNQVAWNQLNVDEQTMLTVLELARINIDDFVAKGGTAAGRTTRSFDKRAASAYLSDRFRDLWRQKNVRFDIDIDHTTLNIFAQDEGVGMPVVTPTVDWL